MTERIELGPGLHDDVSAEAYHADPVAGGSLSSSEARLLIPPSCPAKFRWHKDHPRQSEAFDFGKAAHRLVLDAGEPIDVIKADSWRTKAAKQAREEARANGRVPLLTADHDIVMAMAEAIRTHPIAGPLLTAGGQVEQTLIWNDDRTGIGRRARLDIVGSGSRAAIAEYKTTVDASLDGCVKHVVNYGYHQQQDWYVDGIRSLGLDDDPDFVFIFQEKTAPYLVTVLRLDDEWLALADVRNRWAIDTYLYCRDHDTWPPYSPDVATLWMPPWADKERLLEQ